MVRFWIWTYKDSLLLNTSTFNGQFKSSNVQSFSLGKEGGKAFDAHLDTEMCNHSKFHTSTQRLIPLVPLCAVTKFSQVT